MSNLRGALAGAMISSGFGLAWSQWGASGLSGAASVATRVAGVVVGAALFLCSVRLWLAAPSGKSGSIGMFSSPAYRLAVALEVVAIIGGNLILRAGGHGEYIIAWVATVVGVIFLPSADCLGPASTGWEWP